MNVDVDVEEPFIDEHVVAGVENIVVWSFRASHACVDIELGH